MRAVVLSFPEHELKERHARGADFLDEMWDGVLHMPPCPPLRHQEIAGDLSIYLMEECERTSRGWSCRQVALLAPRRGFSDYRVPDLVFVSKANQRIIRKRGVVGGADAVIDHESLATEVYRLAGKEYIAVAPCRDGWLAADVLGIRLRWNSRRRRLRIEALDDPKHALEL